MCRYPAVFACLALLAGLAAQANPLVAKRQTGGGRVRSDYCMPPNKLYSVDCNGDGVKDSACVMPDGQRRLVLMLSDGVGWEPESPTSYDCPIDDWAVTTVQRPALLPTGRPARLMQQTFGSQLCPECGCSEGTVDCGECWLGRAKGLPCWNKDDDTGEDLCCQCLLILAGK